MFTEMILQHVGCSYQHMDVQPRHTTETMPRRDSSP